jgi:hypothetical protein
VTDGQRDTGWQITDGGPGEWIRLEFDGAVTLDRIGVVPGYDKHSNRVGDLWPLNNRVSEATISWDGGSKRVRFRDDRQMQYVSLGNVQTSWVKLTVDTVSRGRRWNDTVISEMECRGRPSGSDSASSSAADAIDLTRRYLSRVKASSELTSGRVTYSVRKVADGDPHTAWGAARERYRDEWITLSFDREVTVTMVKVLTGYCTTNKRTGTDLFPINRRIKQARLSIGSRSFEHSFPDSKAWQTVAVDPPAIGKSVKLTVLDVYHGTKWPDLHVSEIAVWGPDGG